MNSIKPAERYQRIFKGISNFICKSPIGQKEFISLLRFYLAHTAKELYPNKSISELSQITDLPRATISEFLDKKTPERTQSKLGNLQNELWKNKDENNLIPLKGEKSFYSIAKSSLTSSFSPDTALKRLIELGCIKQFDENRLTVLTISIKVNKSDSDYYEYFDDAIERLFETFLYNHNNNNPMYQNTIWTNKQSKATAAKTRMKIFDYMRNRVFKDLQEMFDQADEDVPDDTYPAFGVSIFEFLDKSK